MSIPTLLVEMGTQAPGFTLDDPIYGLLDSGNTLDAGPLTWDDDITPYVRSFNINRGASSELDQVEAGTGTVTLDNRDGRFTPLLSSSPYYPEIRPSKRIRFQATFSATTYPVMTAFAESWPVTFPGDVDMIVQVAFVDGFTMLSQAVVSGDFPEQSSGARVAAILDAVGWSAAQVSTDVGLATVPAITLDNANALAHIQAIEKAEGGRFFISRDGVATFKDRTPSSLGDSSTRKWADDGTGMSYRDLRLEYSDTRILNDVHLTRPGGAEQVSQDAASMNPNTGYGTRSYVDSDVQLSTDAQVLSLADLLVERYAQPRMRIESLVDNAMQHGFWDRVLSREIGDLVEVDESRTQTAQVSILQGIAHEVTQDTWTVTLSVSPGESGVFFTLDDATLGLLDSGNVLAR